MDNTLNRVQHLLHFCMDWWQEIIEVDAAQNPPTADYYDTIDGMPIIPTAFARQSYGTLNSPQTKNAPADDGKGATIQKEVTQQNSEERDEKAILIPPRKEKQKLLTISQFKKRKRKNSYEARCMINSKAISISAKSTAELKERLRAYVEEFNKLNQPKLPITEEVKEEPVQEVPPSPLFKDYALEYLAVMKKDDVQLSWYKRQQSKLRLHIFPFLGEKTMNEITAFDCKAVMTEVRRKKFFRTAEEVFCLLKQIFEFALSEGVIAKTPMARLKSKKAARNHGRCLSMVEEAHLLSLAKGTRYEYYVILMLYAGLRPCECNTARIKGDFIVANNAKRKDDVVELKRVPITPMMRPYLDFLSQPHEVLSYYSIANWLYEMPWHICAYFCRHTFNTRLVKFKISQELRELAMGHRSSDVNIDTYTHYLEIADTYYMEFQKVDYKEELIRAQNMPKILTPKPPRKPRK